MLTKHWNYALSTAGALSAMLLAGCVDESYDLSDIDTTMKFEVNDLALPLNLAPVEFGSVVDLSDEECIDTINGEYVLVKEGPFESEDITISNFSAGASYEFDEENLGNLTIEPEYAQPGFSTSLIAPDEQQNDYKFSYTSEKVDKAITAVYSGTVDTKEDLVISFKIHASSGNNGVRCKLKNLKFALPKGFYGKAESNGTTFDVTSESNIVQVGDEVYTDYNGDYTFSFRVETVKFEHNPIADFNEEYNKFSLTSIFALTQGEIELTETSTEAVELRTSFHVSDFKVKTISGHVRYEVKNLDPDKINILSDLPDLLQDEQTNIILNNPQLYVKLNNPLAKNRVTAEAGVKIAQIRNGVEGLTAELAEPIQIQDIAEQSFCISQSRIEPNDFIEGFKVENPDAMQSYIMENLNKIVSGNGLPDELLVNFANPNPIMDTDVFDLELITNDNTDKSSLGKVQGNYKFYAPLALDSPSKIYYSDEATDWGLSSEDDQLNIKKLSIDADAVSELPVAVRLTAKPLDDKGNPINVHVNPVDIPAGGKKHITIEMEGDIVNLDGMKYTIIVNAGENTEALKPTQKLTLNNLKVRVSGSYIVEDEDKK